MDVDDNSTDNVSYILPDEDEDDGQEMDVDSNPVAHGGRGRGRGRGRGGRIRGLARGGRAARGGSQALVPIATRGRGGKPANPQAEMRSRWHGAQLPNRALPPLPLTSIYGNVL